MCPLSEFWIFWGINTKKKSWLLWHLLAFYLYIKSSQVIHHFENRTRKVNKEKQNQFIFVKIHISIWKNVHEIKIEIERNFHRISKMPVPSWWQIASKFHMKFPFYVYSTFRTNVFGVFHPGDWFDSIQKDVWKQHFLFNYD